MKALALMAVLLVAVPALAMHEGKPANDTEAVYQEARPEAVSVGSATSELAGEWEKFAESKALIDHATVKGLKGQVEGHANCETCIAWAWNNAAYAWHLVALEKAGKKNRAGYISNLKKALADYDKCLGCENSEQQTKDMATSHKADIESELAKLEKKK